MFSEWLVNRLNDENWKQADLARYTGLTTGAISNYINGKIPDNEALIKIAKAFKIRPERMFQIAGILPKEESPDQTAKDMMKLLEDCTEEEKEDIIKLVKFYMKINEERKRKSAKGK